MSGTSEVSDQLDVLSKYNALVKESLSGDSVYIRAKETVQALVDDGSLDDSKKAEVVSSIVSSAVSSITSSSMSSALEWAKYEKELALRKLELDIQLLVIDQDRLLKEAQVKQVTSSSRLALVESRRMFGVSTFDGNGVLTGLTDSGKVWNDMLLVTQQTTNATVEETLLGSKVKESSAAIHKVVADTYVNFGNFTFAYDASGNGLSSVTRLDAPGGSLSDVQKEIAIEQGKGYTYNAWANALTGSASMLGTVVASGDFTFNNGSNELRLFDAVVTCAESLSSATSTTNEAIPNP